MTEKLEQLYEGKAKKIFRTDNPDALWVQYKDDATAFNGLKKGTIQGKGELNNKISALFFKMLAEKGIPSHFINLLSDTDMLVKPLDIILVEVVVRNVVAGSLTKRIGSPEGTLLKKPIVEFYYKDDALGDPLINNYHALALGLASEAELQELAKQAFAINDILLDYLKDKNIDLVDFKLEFGRYQGKVLLGDEISPDTCRFWDATTKEKLDKDRFRRDLGNVEEAYEEVYRRLQDGGRK